jgi:hypothetical protein
MIPLEYKVLALALVVGGAFFAGYNKGTAGADAKINQFANEVQELELALKKEQQMIREVVKVEYVDRVQTIKEKEIRVVEAAKETVPEQYELSNGWIHAHNAAASPKINLDLSLASDGTSSFVKDNQALQTVVENYSICLQNAQQLSSLQKYILEVNKKIDEENANRGLNIKLPDLPWKKEPDES